MKDFDERQAIRSAFDKASQRYESAAKVQREIADHLATLLTSDQIGGAADQPHSSGAAQILDTGCGTGYANALITKHYGDQRIISLDVAFGMCKATQDAICGDIEALPFKSGSMDLYWSSLAWQWTRPAIAIAEAARVLKFGGHLRVATLGPETLHELRASFAHIDSAQHVRTFDSPEIYPYLLANQGFANIRVMRRRHVIILPTLVSIMRSLRDIGAHTLGDKRRKGLLGRHAWQTLEASYEAFRTPDGLPVSYDAVYLTATRT